MRKSDLEKQARPPPWSVFCLQVSPLPSPQAPWSPSPESLRQSPSQQSTAEQSRLSIPWESGT